MRPFDTVVIITGMTPEREARADEILARPEFDGVRKKKIQAFVGRDLVIPKWFTGRGPYAAGSWGCFMSHFHSFLWGAAKADSIGILVLEDDVEFRDDWLEILTAARNEVPADWRAIYLGTDVSFNRRVERFSEHAGHLNGGGGTHGILWSRRGMCDVIDAIRDNPRPIDVFLHRFHYRFQTFQTIPSAAGQAAMQSDIDYRRRHNSAQFWEPEVVEPRPIDSGKKVIAASLYGHDELYTIGAYANAQLARDILPDWEYRIYIEEGHPLIPVLEDLGVAVYQRPPSKGAFGMFWRLEAIYDPEVSCAFMTDVDSRITERLKLMLQEWFDNSGGRPLFRVRDHPWHKRRALIGGAWGMSSARAPDLAQWFQSMVEHWIRNNGDRDIGYGEDESYLAHLYHRLVGGCSESLLYGISLAPDPGDHDVPIPENIGPPVHNDFICSKVHPTPAERHAYGSSTYGSSRRKHVD